ncbi:MAG TPA: TetR/AcrR family transcriptional regulator [Acidimicrobiales bacterium]|nr:TetR/AcrR family transcriptional regulator [Acidimicrobiales bacterium]
MQSPSSSDVMRTAGRPRDERIDRAVLHATAELLEEVGYQRLTIAAVASRAKTTPPAIYRRWPTKAHLVHEAVFPSAPEGVVPQHQDLRVGLRSMLVSGVQLLSQPAARAAVPALLAELTAAPALHADILSRFSGGEWTWLFDRIGQAIATGEVRSDVSPATLLDMISGSAFLATAVGPPERIDSQWIDEVIDLIMRGIAPDRQRD